MSASSSGSGAGSGAGKLQEFFTAARRSIARGAITEKHVESVQALQRLMADISLEELGLDPDMVADPFLGALKLHLRDSKIKYMRIYEDEQLTFGLFCFPAGSSIPLHNHPGMTVFSRLLFGRLRVSAYDWVHQPDAPVTEGSAPARMVCDTLVEPCTPPLVLFPASGGNLHEFTAETPCAVLDLLTPPYEPPERNCTYYRLQRPDLTWADGGGNGGGGGGGGGGAQGRRGGSKAAPRPRPVVPGDMVELEVFEPPDSFEVVSGLYPGDPVR
ncbi:hypothetical protein HYH03_000793 [Edaphochlamys debaryana]|uniref:cysteine dioxygenase n=1 Tax=Edaphochlamys debaryana TaxID=47281 RepID=A0A835YE85_9CHLO|nr:hypothetical protein HYH03_000793 [Edaphochlamys debaryana]|eukprot:KAG2500971.1 hypothetical protein HYH03_000793 [Edaphochlamys debaryana]